MDQFNQVKLEQLDFYDCPFADLRFFQKNIFDKFVRESVKSEHTEICTNIKIIKKRDLCLVRERSQQFPLLSVVNPRHKEIGRHLYDIDCKLPILCFLLL